jgi:hypothetical protein
MFRERTLYEPICLSVLLFCNIWTSDPIVETHFLHKWPGITLQEWSKTQQLAWTAFVQQWHAWCVVKNICRISVQRVCLSSLVNLNGWNKPSYRPFKCHPKEEWRAASFLIQNLSWVTLYMRRTYCANHIVSYIQRSPQSSSLLMQEVGQKIACLN